MIKRFSTLYAGQVDLDNTGFEGTPVNERWFDNDTLATPLATAEAMAQGDGPPRLRHAVDGGAPLPARRLRVHPEHPHAGGAPGAGRRSV